MLEFVLGIKYFFWVNKVCPYHYGADRLVIASDISYCVAVVHELIGALPEPQLKSDQTFALAKTTALPALDAILALGCVE